MKPASQRGARSHRSRVQIGVFGAQPYFSTASTENVEMGPYPKRVSTAQPRMRSSRRAHFFRAFSRSPSRVRGSPRAEIDWRTFFVLAASWFFDNLAQYLSSSSGGGALPNALQYMSFQTRLSGFWRGLVDSRDVVFFLSVTILSLLVAFRALERRKWA